MEGGWSVVQDWWNRCGLRNNEALDSDKEKCRLLEAFGFPVIELEGVALDSLRSAQGRKKAERIFRDNYRKLSELSLRQARKSR